MVKTLAVFGAHPEAIKMESVMYALNDNFDLKIFLTVLHYQMLDQSLDSFGIELDYDLDIMQPGLREGGYYIAVDPCFI